MARDDLDSLIGRAQEGDVRAFEALLEGHLAQVRRYARAFAAGDAEADDLAQDALIKVYKSLRLFRYQSAFSTWLYAIVRNVFLDAARSRAGKERALEEPLAPEHVEDLPGGVAADEQLGREEERARLWRALRQVSPEFRSAVVLFDLEGRSYDEVAAIEGVPVGTVKSRLSRGRGQLRLLLGEEPAPAPVEPRELDESQPMVELGTDPGPSPSHPPRRRT